MAENAPIPVYRSRGSSTVVNPITIPSTAGIAAKMRMAINLSCHSENINIDASIDDVPQMTVIRRMLLAFKKDHAKAKKKNIILIQRIKLAVIPHFDARLCSSR